MQPNSISSLPACFCPNLKQLFSAHRNTHVATPYTRNNKRRTIFFFCSYDEKQQTQYKTNSPTINISTTTTSTNLQEDKNNIYAKKHLFVDEMYSFLGRNTKTKKDENQDSSEEKDSEVSQNKTHRGISSNMWWTNLKATLGQRLNIEGITTSMVVMTRDRHLALPHISVPDIRSIDWVELERRGFRGVVFDKDNTITSPYSLKVWPPLASSLDCCKSVFGDNVVVFSNSAGLEQYDADGSKARAVEGSIGIHVIRHGVKKPAGVAEDIEKYFGCATSLLIMVGDRHFTDIVYGNRNGFLTILTEPLSLVEEPFVVKQVRKLETSLASYWYRRGLKPISHSLLSEAMQSVKVPPPQ